jgi:hypothetical protein
MRTGLSRLGDREEIAERVINHPPGALVAVNSARAAHGGGPPRSEIRES